LLSLTRENAVDLHSLGSVSSNTHDDDRGKIQGDTKKRELSKNPTKIKEIQEKNLLTEIEPLQLAF